MPGNPHHRLRQSRCAAILVFIAASLAAQEPRSAPGLTVSEAMALARAAHPALAIASASGRSAIGQARQAAAFSNPVLEWRQENLGSPLAPETWLTASQPLSLTGRQLALRREVGDIEARARADSIAVARMVEADAARAFWRASLAHALLDVTSRQRADAERLAIVEGDRAREGAVSELAAMRASLEAERARLTEATARAELTRARADLARAIGVAADSLPVVPALAPAPPRVASIPLLPDVLPGALTHRPELVALRAAVDGAERRLSAERRATLPDASLQVGTKHTAGFTTRTLGVALPLPLFNRNSGAREQAAAGLHLAQAQLRAAEQAVRVEVAASIDALHALASAQSPAADSLSARAADVAQVAGAAYAAGGGSLLELLDARRARADALSAALNWSATLRIARLELNRAIGAPLLQDLEAP